MELVIKAISNKVKVSIVGGGSAALFAACKLDPKKFDVSIYEKNKALGRKFLVAGKGGFNLTHSENRSEFIERYHPKHALAKAFEAFDNDHFRNWLRSIGIETFIGTSKRVFPIKGIKPIEVLNAIETVLKKNNVKVKLEHEWDVNDEKELTNDQIVIYAFGGGSWKVTGSDGSWQKLFLNKGINVKPFEASNCAYSVNWNQHIKTNCAGKALKNVEFFMWENSLDVNEENSSALKLNETNPHALKLRRVKGEGVITEFGIEGSGVYPFSGAVREGLKEKNEAIIYVDLKPDLSLDKFNDKYDKKGKMNTAELLRSLHLSDLSISLIKFSTTKEEYQSKEKLFQFIKKFPVKITGLAPIDEAISTVGGVSFDELNENFELKKFPHRYCIGEMVDWDAPTGGYLLQMCYSMGTFVADFLNKRTDF